jgi:hypothetical protein
MTRCVSSTVLGSRRDNHPLAATAEMAILIVAVFPSRLLRYIFARMPIQPLVGAGHTNV